MRHYGECLRDTVICFGCSKEGNKVRDCPTISTKGRKGKNVAPNVPKDDVQERRRFYALQSRRENPYGSEDDEGKYLNFILTDMSSL